MRRLQYIVVSLESAIDAIDPTKPVAFDVETDGFYGEICMAQFYQAGWKAARLVIKPDLVFLSAVTQGFHLVAHNISYEVSTMQTQLGTLTDTPLHYWAPKDWDDTLLLSKLQFFVNEKFSLDECYYYALGTDPYIDYGLDKKMMQKANWAGHITEGMMKYAAIDVFYLLELYEACKPQWKATSYSLDRVATTRAWKMQTHGFPINKDRIYALMAENDTNIQLEACPINVNSWQQVRPYIGEDESDGLALATYALEGNEKAKQVQKVRKLRKMNSFLKKFIDTAVYDKIFGKFSFTTKSGRGNCKDQNLQQLPRKTKGVFEAPDGKVLLLSDFSALELRYVCAYTGETAMEKLFRNNTDLHQYTADIMGVSRQVSKTCTFNLLYAGSAKMLRSIFITQADIMMELREVQGLKSQWHKLWPILTAWQNKTVDEWQQGKFQHTVLGRQFKSKLYTDACNLPIQGGSADVAKLAMHRVEKALEENEIEADMVNFIHDSYFFVCDDDPAVYEPLAKHLAESMQSAWHEVTQHLTIPDLPMPVSVLVGHNWGDLEDGSKSPIFIHEVE